MCTADGDKMYKKTNKIAIIKSALSGNEFTRVIYKKGNKEYVKNYNQFMPLNKMRIVGKAKRRK